MFVSGSMFRTDQMCQPFTSLPITLHSFISFFSVYYFLLASSSSLFTFPFFSFTFTFLLSCLIILPHLIIIFFSSHNPQPIIFSSHHHLSLPFLYSPFFYLHSFTFLSYRLSHFSHLSFFACLIVQLIIFSSHHPRLSLFFLYLHSFTFLSSPLSLFFHIPPDSFTFSTPITPERIIFSFSFLPLFLPFFYNIMPLLFSYPGSLFFPIPPYSFIFVFLVP